MTNKLQSFRISEHRAVQPQNAENRPTHFLLCNVVFRSGSLAQNFGKISTEFHFYTQN